MAEGLGIAASIAGLITLADIVVRKGYKFLKEAKDAEKTVKKIVDEVNGLPGVLYSLNNVVTRLEEDDSGFDPITQIHYVESCYQTLVTLQKHFEEALPKAPMSKLERLVWPLKQSQSKELLRDLERHKATMLLAMGATEMSALLQVLSRQKNTSTTLARLDDHRARREEKETNDKRQIWLDFLAELDPGKWQDTNIRLRQPGTGIWFTDGKEMKYWLSTPRSYLWIYGIAGAGKTILVASIIQEIQRLANEDNVVAFFYCDYKNPDTHNDLTILGSLARQLAFQNEECFADLEDFYQQHLRPDGMVRESTVDELLALIVSLSSHYHSVMIVVDGLDEIAHNRARITRALQSLKSSTAIKTLFASRLEVDIQDELRDYLQVSIAAKSSDLRLYVAAEIEQRTRDKRLRIQDLDLKEHIMKKLVDGADGMYVRCRA